MQTILPKFAEACGLRPADVELMDGEVRADALRLQFTERDLAGNQTGVASLHGPDVHLFSRGGRRALFSAPPRGIARRVLLASGEMEALCAAAWEGHHKTTVYAAPPGSWTLLAEEALLGLIQSTGAEIVDLAFKPDRLGDALAAHAAEVITDTFDGAVAMRRCAPRQSWSYELCWRRRRRAAA